MTHRLRTGMTLLLAFLLLIGCSSSKPEGVPRNKLPDNRSELVIMTSIILNREALDSVIDLYEEKHPTIKVRVKDMNVDIMNADGSINQAVIEGVDLLVTSSSHAKRLHGKGIGRDLANLRLPTLDPLVAGLADEISFVDGARIGVPLQIHPNSLMLNTPIFKKANVDLPPVDWTIQEFEQTVMQLRSAGVKHDLHISLVLAPIIGAFGGQIIDPATKEVLIDRPESVAALTWLGHAIQNHLITYSLSTEPLSFTVGGEEGPPISGRVGVNTALPPDVILQSMPRGPAGRRTTITGTVGFVFTTSPNPEMAIDFLREMIADPEAQRAMARAGVRPLLNDSQAISLWRERVGDRHADVIDLGLGSGITVWTGWGKWTDGLQAFFEGRASLEQILPAVKQSLTPS